MPKYLPGSAEDIRDRGLWEVTKDVSGWNEAPNALMQGLRNLPGDIASIPNTVMEMVNPSPMAREPGYVAPSMKMRQAIGDNFTGADPRYFDNEKRPLAQLAYLTGNMADVAVPTTVIPKVYRGLKAAAEVPFDASRRAAGGIRDVADAFKKGYQEDVAKGPILAQKGDFPEAVQDAAPMSRRKFNTLAAGTVAAAAIPVAISRTAKVLDEPAKRMAIPDTYRQVGYTPLHDDIVSKLDIRRNLNAAEVKAYEQFNVAAKNLSDKLEKAYPNDAEFIRQATPDELKTWGYADPADPVYQNAARAEDEYHTVLTNKTRQEGVYNPRTKLDDRFEYIDNFSSNDPKFMRQFDELFDLEIRSGPKPTMPVAEARDRLQQRLFHEGDKLGLNSGNPRAVFQNKKKALGQLSPEKRNEAALDDLAYISRRRDRSKQMENRLYQLNLILKDQVKDLDAAEVFGYRNEALKELVALKRKAINALDGAKGKMTAKNAERMKDIEGITTELHVYDQLIAKKGWTSEGVVPYTY